MRPARHTRRRRNRQLPLFRRCKPRRQVDLPVSDDDDEDIIEIGGPADDKPATG